MKKIIIRYMLLMAVSMLMLACPPTTDDGSNGNRDTQKLLYYSNQTFSNNTSGVDGLYGSTSVTVSPDGKNVYAIGFLDDTVAVFSRDTSTGFLTFVERVKNGVKDSAGTTVDGLDGPVSVTTSYDNKYVYVASIIDDAIAVFKRDSVDKGKLTFVERVKNGVKDSAGTTVGGLDGVRSVIVSPDNNNVYVVSYTDGAVVVFSRNTSTGSLAFEQVIKNNDLITGSGKVEGLDGAYTVTVSPDNNNVYVASWNDDAVVVFNRDTTDKGKLNYSTKFKNGEGGVDGLDEANSVVVSPDGKNVYATGAKSDAVVMFDRDMGTGALTYSTRLKDGENGVDGLDTPSAVVVSPDGKDVYVIGYADNAVAVFTRDTSTGALNYYEIFMNGTRGFDATPLGSSHFTLTSMVISHDGNNMYVTTDYSSLGVFERR